jgi:hypothetical protein
MCTPPNASYCFQIQTLQKLFLNISSLSSPSKCDIKKYSQILEIYFLWQHSSTNPGGWKCNTTSDFAEVIVSQNSVIKTLSAEQGTYNEQGKLKQKQFDVRGVTNTQLMSCAY